MGTAECRRRRRGSAPAAATGSPAGWLSIALEAGLPVEPDLIVHAGLNRKNGEAAPLDLLHRPDRPTAIFACNDLQALGVHRAQGHRHRTPAARHPPGADHHAASPGAPSPPAPGIGPELPVDARNYRLKNPELSASLKDIDKCER
jgi:hypothetical protein